MGQVTPRVRAETAVTPAPAALEGQSISVAFGQVQALQDVSLAFEPGKIHVIVGQNGAGKTTAARVFAGMQRPDAGRVRISGEDVPLGDVNASRRMGVEIVHQNLALPPSFTVAEALELFSTKPRSAPFYSHRRLEDEWQEQVRLAGLQISLRTRIHDLPIEMVQALEITRVLASNARVLILDEPSAILTPTARDALFDRLRSLRDSGVTVILILHKLQEVTAVAETVSVLREGRVVLSATPVQETTHRMLSDLIIGGSQVTAERPTTLAETVERALDSGSSVLILDHVTTQPSGTDARLDDVSLEVRSGEIVGIAGVEGNGQLSLVRAVTGLESVAGGRVRLGETDVTSDSATRRRKKGVRVIPFDRNTEGVSQTSGLWENVGVLSVVLGQASRGPWLPVRRLKARARDALDQWRVRYHNVDQRAGELSGGNVQRTILARELAPGVRLLVAAQPTRGLDVAATMFVRQTLKDLRASGAGILLVSSDLDELLDLSDRLLVLLGGTVVAEFVPPYQIRAIGDSMVGATS